MRLEKTQVAQWKQRLRSDAEFADLKQLREQNALQGFRALLTDERLPGDNLKDRMDFVLAVTADNSVAPTHFSPDVSFSDGGLREDLRDSPLWGTKWSNQIGHFLTAVDMGQRALTRYGMYAAMTVGHELSGDLVKGGNYSSVGGLLKQSVNVAHQLMLGMSPAVLRALDRGIEAAKQGDTAGVDQAAQDIMGGTPDSELPQHRSGNSQADLKLTMYGWAWGEMIESGESQTLEQGAAFLDYNLAPRPLAA